MVSSQQHEHIEQVHKDLQANLTYVKELFSYPTNSDFSIKELFIRSLQVRATIVYLEGMVDESTVKNDIVAPLMEERRDHENPGITVFHEIIPLKGMTNLATLNEVVDEIIQGSTVLLIDGYEEAISMSTVGYEQRGIDKPQTETALKGPLEAFVESGSVNRSLIRKQLRSHQLLSETISIGNHHNTKVSMLYMKDIADPGLVTNVQERIKQIQSADVQNLSLLEQHIEERTYSLVPSVLYTERPDRAAAFLKEGHIVLLMDSSPACLIVPVTFWSFFHTAEDSYQRIVYGSFTRIVRIIAIFIALLAPSFYIAITNHHIEMVPTDLVLAIAATREIVPFPAIFELIVMELAFEILREAGLRIPTPMGPTIGIVGALILGQAAVEANIVSPILVIVIALTGLASFAIPDLSLSFMIRISRFLFLLFATAFGFFGLGICLTLCITYIVSLKSFGVAFLSPMTPHYRSSKDLILRVPIWKQWLRPFNIHPKDQVRREKPEGR